MVPDPTDPDPTDPDPTPTRLDPTPTHGPRPDPSSDRVPLTPDHGPRQTNIGWTMRGPQQGRNSRPPIGNRRNSTQLDEPIHLRG